MKSDIAAVPKQLQLTDVEIMIKVTVKEITDFGGPFLSGEALSVGRKDLCPGGIPILQFQAVENRYISKLFAWATCIPNISLFIAKRTLIPA